MLTHTARAGCSQPQAFTPVAMALSHNVAAPSYFPSPTISGTSVYLHVNTLAWLNFKTQGVVNVSVGLSTLALHSKQWVIVREWPKN